MLPSGGGTSGQGVYGRAGLSRVDSEALLKVKHYRKLGKRSCRGLETSDGRGTRQSHLGRAARTRSQRRSSSTTQINSAESTDVITLTDRQNKSPLRPYNRVEGYCLTLEADYINARSGFYERSKRIFFNLQQL